MSILSLPARGSRRSAFVGGSRRSKRGATALEYALVLAFVAVAVLGALSTLGDSLTETITGVGETVQTAADGV